MSERLQGSQRGFRIVRETLGQSQKLQRGQTFFRAVTEVSEGLNIFQDSQIDFRNIREVLGQSDRLQDSSAAGKASGLSKKL